MGNQAQIRKDSTAVSTSTRNFPTVAEYMEQVNHWNPRLPMSIAT